MNQKSMTKSNYQVEVMQETCQACGLCIKRCPMDAIELKFSTRSTNKFRKAIVVDTDVCIGCGVCVHKCKTKAITLNPREEPIQHPETVMDLFTQIGTAVLTEKARQ